MVNLAVEIATFSASFGGVAGASASAGFKAPTCTNSETIIPFS